jgi:phytoene dehydrogenase-like protein
MAPSLYLTSQSRMGVMRGWVSVIVSRASYLAGLLRPQIIKDLELEKYGFKYLPRNPTSFTPSLPESHLKGKYLMLGDSAKENAASIAQFSQKDAIAFDKYEEFQKKGKPSHSCQSAGQLCN